MHPRWPAIPLDHVPDSPRLAIAFALDIRKLITGDPLSEEIIDFGTIAQYGDFKIEIFWHDEEPASSWSDAHFGAFREHGWIDYDPRPHDQEGRRYEGDRHTTICRGRFLIGHEIAHSFFYERRNVPEGDLPRETGCFDRWASTEPNSDMEYFCDVFAGALLLPPPKLKESRFASLTHAELGKKFSVPPGIIKWMRLGFDKQYFRKNWLRLDELLPE